MDHAHYICKSCSKDLSGTTLAGRVHHVKRCSASAVAGGPQQLLPQDTRSWLKVLYGTPSTAPISSFVMFLSSLEGADELHQLKTRSRTVRNQTIIQAMRMAIAGAAA